MAINCINCVALKCEGDASSLPKAGQGEGMGNRSSTQQTSPPTPDPSAPPGHDVRAQQDQAPRSGRVFPTTRVPGTQALDLREGAPTHTCWAGPRREALWRWVPSPLLAPRTVPALLTLTCSLTSRKTHYRHPGRHRSPPPATSEASQVWTEVPGSGEMSALSQPGRSWAEVWERAQLRENAHSPRSRGRTAPSPEMVQAAPWPTPGLLRPLRTPVGDKPPCPGPHSSKAIPSRGLY